MSSVNDQRRARLHALIVETVESVPLGTHLTIPILLPGRDAVAVIVANRQDQLKAAIMLQDDTSTLGRLILENHGGPAVKHRSDLAPMLFGGTDPKTGLRGPAARIARAGIGPRRSFYPFLMSHGPAGARLPSTAEERRFLIALESLMKARNELNLTGYDDVNLKSFPGIVVTAARGEAGDQGIDLELRDFDLSYLGPALEGSPLPPELDRWHGANNRASKLIIAQVKSSASGAAETMSQFFGAGDHDQWMSFMEMNGAATAYIEWQVRCFRSAPGQATALEEILVNGRPYDDADARDILQARTRARPSLYRSYKLAKNDVVFEDVFSGKREVIDLDLWAIEFSENLIRTLTLVDFGPFQFPIDAGPVFNEKELPRVFSVLSEVSGVSAAEALIQAPHAAGRLFRLRAELDAAGR